MPVPWTCAPAPHLHHVYLIYYRLCFLHFHSTYNYNVTRTHRIHYIMTFNDTHDLESGMDTPTTLTSRTDLFVNPASDDLEKAASVSHSVHLSFDQVLRASGVGTAKRILQPERLFTFKPPHRSHSPFKSPRVSPNTSCMASPVLVSLAGYWPSWAPQAQVCVGTPGQ